MCGRIPPPPPKKKKGSNLSIIVSGKSLKKRFDCFLQMSTNIFMFFFSNEHKFGKGEVLDSISQTLSKLRFRPIFPINVPNLTSFLSNKHKFGKDLSVSQTFSKLWFVPIFPENFIYKVIRGKTFHKPNFVGFFK